VDFVEDGQDKVNREGGMVVRGIEEVGEETSGKVRLKVVGVGGCGCNAVNRMIRAELTGVDFVAVNTDLQALNNSMADTKIQIGARVAKGRGAGGNSEIGEQAAEESMKDIEEHLNGSHMVFIAAGMGGGTGTGAAPIIARAARDAGAITVGIVTRPFEFENSIRLNQAEMGISALRKVVDTLIVIPNERLTTLAEEDSTLEQMFDLSNSVLLNAVDGISSLITTPGIVNRDFQDVKTVITYGGGAMMGTGKASGPSRAVEAAREAISGPLLDGVSIEGAKALLVNIQASCSLKYREFQEAMETVTRATGPQANVFFGTSLNDRMGDELRVTVLATGFGNPEPAEPEEISFPSEKPAMARVQAGQPREHIPFVQAQPKTQVGAKAPLSIPSFLQRSID
jgi:cell division protein FtsZ